MSISTIVDYWKRAGWIACKRCGVFFHPLHSYDTDGVHCASCTGFIRTYEVQ